MTQTVTEAIDRRVTARRAAVYAKNEARYRELIFKLASAGKLAEKELDELTALCEAMNIPLESPAKDAAIIQRIEGLERAVGDDPQVNLDRLWADVCSQAATVQATQSAFAEAKKARSVAEWAHKGFSQNVVELQRLKQQNPRLFPTVSDSKSG